MRKFNKGDKVVIFPQDTNYYGNDFHWKKIFKTSIVSDANDEIFCLDGRKIDDNLRPHNTYSQKHGWDKSGSSLSERAFHIEKDRELINETIQKYKEDYLSEQRENTKSEIDSIQQQIIVLNNKLQKLKSGDWSVKYGMLFDLSKQVKEIDDYIDSLLK